MCFYVNPNSQRTLPVFHLLGCHFGKSAGKVFRNNQAITERPVEHLTK
jgi:hypothetical protein